MPTHLTAICMQRMILTLLALVNMHNMPWHSILSKYVMPKTHEREWMETDDLQTHTKVGCRALLAIRSTAAAGPVSINLDQRVT